MFSVVIIGLRKRTNHDPTDLQILRRKWRWIGRTLGKPAANTLRQVRKGNPQGTRKRRLPRNSWRTGIQHETSRRGLNRGDLERSDIHQRPVFPRETKGLKVAAIIFIYTIITGSGIPREDLCFMKAYRV